MSYIAFARTARTFNEHTASSVTFMTECLVELYGLEMGSAYQTAFVYVRQLALHLRAAMVKKTPESIRQITSWQFLNCVRVWTRILCKYPSKDALYPLVYPFCQVRTCNGVVNYILDMCGSIGRFGGCWCRTVTEINSISPAFALVLATACGRSRGFYSNSGQTVGCVEHT